MISDLLRVSRAITAVLVVVRESWFRQQIWYLGDEYTQGVLSGMPNLVLSGYVLENVLRDAHRLI